MDKIRKWIKTQYHDVKGNAKWDFIKGGFVAMCVVIPGIWGVIRPSTLSGWVSLAALTVGLLMLAVAIIKFFVQPSKPPQNIQGSPDNQSDEFPPSIAGIWVKRKTGGTLTLEQTGIKIWGTYSEGDWEETIEGFFKPNGRKFEVKTTRVDTTSREGRYIQNETFVLLDENTLFFHCVKDFYGKEDAGILIRRGTTSAYEL